MSVIAAYCLESDTVSYLPWCLASVFCLSVYSDAYPYGIPLFFPLAFLLFIWFGLVRKRLRVPVNTGVVLFLICLLFYCVGLLETGHIYRENARDLQNSAGVMLMTPLLFSLDLREFRDFRSSAQTMGAAISAVIAVVGLYKFHLMMQGVDIDLFWVEGRPYPWGTSLVIDYNFFAFAMLIGALSSLFCLRRSSTVLGRVYYQLCFVLASIAMALSGSRRGWVTEGLFFLSLTILTIWSGLKSFARFHRSFALSKQGLKTFAALLIVLTIGLCWQATYGQSAVIRDAGVSDEVQTLHQRFLTLTDPDQAFDERTERWTYTAEVLSQSSLAQLVFGQGFDYLSRFASVFQTRGGEDYPHNPILSTALYSGVIGAFWALLLLIVAAVKFCKCLYLDSYFASIYFASLWFVIPSFNTLFSGKFLLLLLLIPWMVEFASRSIAHETRLTSST